MKYCIMHETVTNLPFETSENCLFVECPPPAEWDLDGWKWMFGLPEPTEDELILMDMNAEVFEADFIGE